MLQPPPMGGAPASGELCVESPGAQPANRRTLSLMTRGQTIALIAGIGTVLAIIGLILGLTSVYAGSVDCGSGFRGAPTLSLACAGARSTRLTITWAVLAPAIICFIAAGWLALTRYEGRAAATNA